MRGKRVKVVITVWGEQKKGENRMKKKILAVLLTAAMAVSGLTACGDSSGTESKENSVNDKKETEEQLDGQTSDDKYSDVLVGMSITNMDVYNTLYLEYIEAQLDELGIKYIVTDGENDISKQLSDVESLISSECDVIVMNPLYQDSSGTCTTAINDAGIPLIVRDSMTYDGTCNLFVGNPPDVQCELLANYIIENYLAKDPEFELNICACVGFLADESRWKPMLANLQASEYADRIHVLDEKEGLWTMEEATTIAEDWVQTYDNVNYFFCENDEMAVACVNVLKAAGKDPADYIITGFNGDQIAQDAINAGEMTCTMFFDQRVGASLIVQGILLLLEGYTIDEADRDLDMVATGAISVMDKSNIAELTGATPSVDLRSYLEAN